MNAGPVTEKHAIVTTLFSKFAANRQDPWHRFVPKAADCSATAGRRADRVRPAPRAVAPISSAAAAAGPSRAGNKTDSRATRDQVRGAANADPENVELRAVSDADVVKGAADQIAAAGSACNAVARRRAVQMTPRTQIKIPKAECTDGAQYQVTLVVSDNKGFVKPWTGVLLGNWRQ